MREQFYWVYILLCSNQTYYTGYTNHLSKRYQSHLSGTGKCKYTRSFKPIAMVQSWKIQGEKAEAMRVERHIKTLTRKEKEAVIGNPSSLVSDVVITPIDPKELSSINLLSNLQEAKQIAGAER